MERKLTEESEKQSSTSCRTCEIDADEKYQRNYGKRIS